MDKYELEQAAQRLVANEVFYCVSHLIAAALADFAAATALGFDEDDLLTLSERRPDAKDYEEAAPEGYRIVPFHPAIGSDFEGSPPKWKGFAAAEETPDVDIADFDDELSAWRDLFEIHSLDEPAGDEIFEYWIISDWLAEKLEEKGEAVARDVLGLTIWGRAATGQMIIGDGVIEAITRDLHAPKAEGC